MFAVLINIVIAKIVIADQPACKSGVWWPKKLAIAR
jgi:hypothetical protein